MSSVAFSLIFAPGIPGIAGSEHIPGEFSAAKLESRLSLLTIITTGASDWMLYQEVLILPSPTSPPETSFLLVECRETDPKNPFVRALEITTASAEECEFWKKELKLYFEEHRNLFCRPKVAISSPTKIYLSDSTDRCLI